MDDFAEKSGISKAYISILEKNRHPRDGKPVAPSDEMYMKVARAINMKIDELLKMVGKDQYIIINADNQKSTVDSRLIDKYKTLDYHGKKAIDTLLEIDPVTTYKLKQWRYKNREEEYVFPNTKGSFTTFSQPWHQLSKLKSHDIKIISPHGFRHTHCSMLFSAGVPIHLVQARLGHSDIKTTMNIYNHIYKVDEKKAVTKFMSYVRSRD